MRDEQPDEPERSMSAAELLGSYARILAELRRRGIVRTNNAPLGDYAEYLVAAALGGTLAASTSEGSYDLDAEGWGKVQVKARTVELPVRAGQLQTSPFRSWGFDHAALVLLRRSDYGVHRAVLAPVELVQQRASWRKHINGHIVHMRPGLLDADGVVDITDRVEKASQEI